MPKIRSLKPEHRQHRKIGPLSHFNYRLWVGMICEADDEGRLVADVFQLRALIFAYHPKVTVKHVVDGLEELAAVGLITLYTVGETRYVAFPSWRDHQRIKSDHFVRSMLPPPLTDLQDDPSRGPAGGQPGAEGGPAGGQPGAGSDRIGTERKGSEGREGSVRGGKPRTGQNLTRGERNGHSPNHAAAEFKRALDGILSRHPEIGQAEAESQALAQVQEAKRTR